MAEIIQVALRGSRKEFFLNSRSLWLKLRDRVIVSGGARRIDRLGLPQGPHAGRPQTARQHQPRDHSQDHRRGTSIRTINNRVLEVTAFEYCRGRIEARELTMDLSEVEVGSRAPDHLLLLGRAPRGLPGPGQGSGGALPHPHRAAPDRRARPGQAPRWLRTLRARVLLLLDLAQGLPPGARLKDWRASSSSRSTRGRSRGRAVGCCAAWPTS